MIGPASAYSWRDTSSSIHHDVFVRTSNNSLFGRRCSGTDNSCTWSSWIQINPPASVNFVDSPAYSTESTFNGRRFDLYIRDSNNCIWNANWNTFSIPITPTWSPLPSCTFASRVAAVNWTDALGRTKSTILGFDINNVGLLWINSMSSDVGDTQGDVWTGWEDIADHALSINNP